MKTCNSNYGQDRPPVKSLSWQTAASALWDGNSTRRYLSTACTGLSDHKVTANNLSGNFTLHTTGSGYRTSWTVLSAVALPESMTAKMNSPYE